MKIISDEEIQEVQRNYKTQYQPFRPYHLPAEECVRLIGNYQSLIKTQNGMDTDDYCVPEDNKVARYMKQYAGKRALLLGVGTGREVVTAKELGMEAYGITLGSRNVDFGRNYLGLSEVELQEVAMEVMPFRSNVFDVVAGFQIFEHFVSPLLVLLELGRVIKIGGQLILEWPPANEQYSMGDNPHHQICYTPGQAKVLFQKAGFGDIKLYYNDMSPIPESEYWKGDQNKMLVIEGTKYPTGQEYILNAWSR